MTRGTLLLSHALRLAGSLWNSTRRAGSFLLALLTVQCFAQFSSLSTPDLQVFVRSPSSGAADETAFGERLQLEEVPRGFGPESRVAVLARNVEAQFGGGIVEAFAFTAGEPTTSPASPFDAIPDGQASTAGFSSQLTATLAQRFQIGAGVDLMWADSNPERFYPALSAALPMESAEPKRYETDVSAVRGNVGLGFCITEHQSVSLSYRTPFEIDYRGDLLGNNVSSTLGGGVFRTETKTHVKFPTIIGAGYSINVTEKLKLEAELEWLQFSKFKDLPLMVANELPGLPGSVNENWRDAFSLGFGGEYRLGEHWVVHAGYQFYQSPAPNSSGVRDIRNADQNVLTVGIGFSHNRHAVQAAYGVDLFDTLIGDAHDSSADGSDHFAVHLLSLAYKFVF